MEAAALLHDVDKLERVKPHVGGLAHGEGSADWLARQGYGELGPVVVGHPVTRLADGEWFDRWLAGASPEAVIVAYADKRAGQRLESMAERFASWERRYPAAERAGHARDNWSVQTLEAVRGRAEEIERVACELAAVTPADVRRLEWTGRAFAAARKTGTARQTGALETGTARQTGAAAGPR